MIPFELVTPLLIVALGALWSERAGVLNIALEGQMLAGALAGILGWQATGDLGLALGLALVVGALTGLVLAWGALDLGADPFIAALGLNLALPTLTGWVTQSLYGNLGVVRPEVAPEGLALPFFVGALALAGLSHLVLFHSPWGLRLRAAGSGPDLLRARGLGPVGPQRQALVLSGALGALGGASLALTLGAFVPGLSAGRGWIALVALYLGFRRPLPLVVACLVLGWTEQASNLLQGLEGLPPGVLLGLPSLITTAVFVAASAARASRLSRGSRGPASAPRRR